MANPSWSKAKYAARGVHLGQDTAGRLLESMGNHTRREMIVRNAQAVRQNPAYRPFADNMTTSDNYYRRLFFFLSPPISESEFCCMHARFEICLPFVFLLASCVSSRPAPRAPAPTPQSSTVAQAANSPRVWTFSFTPGLASYRVLRSAVIETSGDSTARREISTNLTHESLTLQSVGDTITFTAVIDTFSTTTQGVIGAAQTVPLPLALNGFMTSDSLILAGDSLPNCSPLTTTLATDIHNLLPRLPASLSTGSTWHDSTSLLGCQGSIPTRSRLTHSYSAVGGSTYENIPVLVIERADTIHAEGEGAQQQHRVILEVAGVGTATYYLDAHTGRVLHLSVDQTLNLTITASGTLRSFRQTTKQEFAQAR